MELIEFKQQIEQAEIGKIFDYGVSEPFLGVVFTQKWRLK